MELKQFVCVSNFDIIIIITVYQVISRRPNILG